MKLEIEGGLPGSTTIRLDGQDLTGALDGLTLRLGVNQLPSVDLELPMVEVTRMCVEDPEILIPAATRDLLVRLGWTPPDGEAAE